MTVQTHTLSNGFRIVTEHMPGLKSATVGVWVAAGARHEQLEQNGIAHFLEHMAFKGTETRTALQIAETIEDVGGFINAYTSREVTAYYARVLQEDVPLGVELIADILINPIFDPREIEVERGVILQEIGQALDTPDDIIFDWLQEAAFADQALGRTILGPAERVSQFSRQDLSAFVGSNYGPERMVLSAAGAVDHERLVAQAEALFGALPRKEDAAAQQSARFIGGQRIETKALEQVHFTLGIEGPDYRGSDIYTAQIYASALGGGMSSRLFQEVREKRGLCYSIFAQAGAYSDTGMLTIYAGTSAAQIRELAHLTVDELKRACDTLNEAEIARARTQMKAGLLMGLESPSNRAERLAHMVQVHGHVRPLDQVIESIDAVTAEHVREFARGVVERSNHAMAIYGPASDAPDLDDLKRRMVA